MPLGTNTNARFSVPGVGRPYLRSHFPDEAKGSEWRRSAGNTYPGPLIDQEVPEGRDFRVRFGVGFQLGRGYRLGYGQSDPYFADPSEKALPYTIDASGLTSNQDIPVALKVWRWSVSGVGRPGLRSTYPSASMGASWRRSVGNVVGLETEAVDVDLMPSVIIPSTETASIPTYTEEIV
ncbi:MAG: hypothetical protein KC587_04325 [Nitrospira sp.]|nr:hypothetical protein [Nitrospira sp.]